MSKRIACAFIFVALSACSRGSTSDAAPSASAATSAPAKATLPPECEEYLTQLKCYTAKTVGPEKAEILSKQQHDTYLAAASTPTGAATQVETCKKSLASMASTFAAQGCGSGPVASAPVSVAKPIASAPKPAATHECTPGASIWAEGLCRVLCTNDTEMCMNGDKCTGKLGAEKYCKPPPPRPKHTAVYAKDGACPAGWEKAPMGAGCDKKCTTDTDCGTEEKCGSEKICQ